ncbi:MBG domain-containing protein [Halosquirtibacter laminarini]|uniref:MBG domain-containing protein n=1 Tax=Halosquirtibacter laminarini TaxID=3374600 RepID=A0AC61NJ67_9BACT|nr:MBG domain-containing protein [Prolixibacteraceae bacterium]
MSKFMFALLTGWFMLLQLSSMNLCASTLKKHKQKEERPQIIESKSNAKARPTVYISVLEQTRLYTQDNPDFPYTISGADVSESEIDVLPTVSCKADRYSPKGNYEITLSGGSDDVYDIVLVNSVLHVQELISKEIMIEVPMQTTLTYDGNTKSVPYELVSGKDDTGREIILNHEIIQLKVTYVDEDYNEVDPLHAGSYMCKIDITDPSVSDLVKPKECFLDILKAPLSIRVDDLVKEQGKANPPFTYTYNGFLGTDTKEDIDQLPTVTCDVTTESTVGTYDIRLLNAQDNDYDITLQNGVFEVRGPSPDVNFVMEDKTVEYNGYAHGVAVTVTPSGFTYTLTYNGSSKVPSEVGTYEVVAVCTDDRAGSNKGYSKKCVLIIQKATIYITADNKECYFGEEIPKLTYSINGLVGSDSGVDILPTISCTATKESAPGEYNISLLGGSDPNYNLHLTNGKLTISNKTLTITFGENEFEYDGMPKSIEYYTDPEGVTCEITYNDQFELPISTGEYTVRVRSIDPNYIGEGETKMLIWAEKEEVDAVNAIIDNGSNNTILKINNIEAFANNTLTLYDRAGNLIYQSTGVYQNDYDLQPLHEGTYFYLLSYDYNGEKVYEKKFVELIRP